MYEAVFYLHKKFWRGIYDVRCAILDTYNIYWDGCFVCYRYLMHIINAIRKELKAHVDERYRAGVARFFTEPIACYGVRAPIVRKIAQKYFRQVKDKEKKEIFALCEVLLQSDYNEEATIAFAWAYALRGQYDKGDLDVYEKWIACYVNNWAKCDDFCTHAVGVLVQRYPQGIARLHTWAISPNRWMRRSAAVALIPSVRKGLHITDALAIADVLFYDTEDLVQKGYGWLLKEASNVQQEKVFRYVMKRKKDMPRTALRYAIEKMPKELKTKAMAKEK